MISSDLELTTNYLNFPIELLDGFLENKNHVLENIRDYSLYTLSMNLDFGEEMDKFKDQARFLDIYIENSEVALDNGVGLFIRYGIHSPMAGIKVSVWSEFYFKEKTEFIMVCLLGHLALKSILGDKPYCKLTNQYWFSRMSGKRSTMEEIDRNSKLSKFSTPYYLNKIKNELEDCWSLTHYGSYTRGFYVSYKMNFKELVNQVEMNRKKYHSKKKKIMKKKIVAEVINNLHCKEP